VILERLPKNASGKTLKRALRTQLAPTDSEKARAQRSW
jgi:acyl-coenzyme A synthetase/AMP-(fatty) acid ligase